MKNIILLMLMDILITIGLAGCSANQSDRGKDLQGLSQIEIYICSIISYKTPVAACQDGSLEKWMELTVYEDSSIIKEQIAPETIKGGYVPKEFLTFYVTVSDEDKNLILSLME